MRAALVILDGWAIGDHDRRDAVRAAETPTVDAISERGAFATLETHGRRVGLPAGQMGNSEVGHLTIGAGRIVPQESARITAAVREDRLGENQAIASAFAHADRTGGQVHLVGLVSDGGVHSRQEHIHALIGAAAAEEVDAVTHAITDGRDTAPRSAPAFLRDLDGVVERAGTGSVATVTGRYYAMDRDENWDRTRLAYDAIVNREAPHEAPSAVAAVERAHGRGDSPGDETTHGEDDPSSDEHVVPTLVRGGSGVSDGDAVIHCNFRADRARQLTRMLANVDPEWGFETAPPDTRVVTMTEYDRTYDLPVAFPPREPDRPLGAVLAEAELTQLRVAESEKYAHVTYFLNGGREVEFEGERRHIVKSPDVPTYDRRPEMAAPAVTDVALGADDADVLVLNYASPDMVGHTGDFEAAIDAVEAVDTQLGRLLDGLHAAGSHVVVTADHGNADDMGTADDPHTAHTTNPVPIVYLAPDGTDGGHQLAPDGGLADVAPTILDVLDVEPPEVMTGTSLLP